MAAPALVALAHGSRDPRSAATVTALVAEVKALRPDLRIERAFLELAKPNFQTVVDKLVRAGYDEIVVVPLLLNEAFHAKVDVPEQIAEATTRHPGLQIRATDVLGLEARFLEVLDERMREALKEARVRELDALVLAAAGSSDPLANQAVARLARVWGTHHKLPVTAAYAAAAPPATGEAVRAFRAEGRRHIAVASLFLAPGSLLDRATELAFEAGAVAVSEPLGAHPEIARTVLARYAVGAVELVPVWIRTTSLPSAVLAHVRAVSRRRSGDRPDDRAASGHVPDGARLGDRRPQRRPHVGDRRRLGEA